MLLVKKDNMMSNLAVVDIMKIQMMVTNLLEFAYSVFLILAAHSMMPKNKSLVLDCMCYNSPSGKKRDGFGCTYPT